MRNCANASLRGQNHWISELLQVTIFQVTAALTAGLGQRYCSDQISSRSVSSVGTVQVRAKKKRERRRKESGGKSRRTPKMRTRCMPDCGESRTARRVEYVGPSTRPICRYHERCCSGIFPTGTPLTSSHESAAARPLALVKRPDLVVFAQTLGGRTYMGLKDPLALHYYHLRPEEYFVFQQLDGRTSAEQIRAAFEREFAPRSSAWDSCRVSARCCTARG